MVLWKKEDREKPEIDLKIEVNFGIKFSSVRYHLN